MSALPVWPKLNSRPGVHLALLAALVLAGCTESPSVSSDGDVGLPDGAILPDGPPRDLPPGGDAALCSGSSCNRPPAPSCSDDKTREFYDPVGRCVDGRCEYTPRSETCGTRCVAGICIGASSVVHVDGRNAGSEDGSAEQPYRTITAALSAAGASAALFVAAGTYEESLTIGAQGVELVGGFAGGSAADYAGGAGGDFGDVDPQTHATVLDAPSGPSISLDYVDGILIYGFTITGAGRGIGCEGGDLKVVSCAIRDNNAGGQNGGGILATNGCDLVLRDSTVENNKANRGGAVAAYEGRVDVLRCVIRNNEGTDDHGGGLYLAGEVEVHDNWIEGNVVGRSMGYGWGGGVLVQGKGTVGHLSGNVVTGNSALTCGAGVFIDDEAEALIENDLYFKNVCGERGGAGLYVDGLTSSLRSKATVRNITIADHACGGVDGALLVEAATVTLENSILWNNGGAEIELGPGGELSVRYSDVQSAQDGEGNISVDPLFVGGGGAYGYALRSPDGHWDGAAWVSDAEKSPCIDTGDPQTPFAEEPVPHGSRVNMGAFGGTAEASKSPEV